MKQLTLSFNYFPLLFKQLYYTIFKEYIIFSEENLVNFIGFRFSDICLFIKNVIVLNFIIEIRELIVSINRPFADNVNQSLCLGACISRISRSEKYIEIGFLIRSY